jgi:hypothetical protein
MRGRFLLHFSRYSYVFVFRRILRLGLQQKRLPGLLLLDRNQWEDFFQEAGLTAEYLPDAFSSRGLYVVRDSGIDS